MEKLTPEQAFTVLVQVAHQGKFTLAESEQVKSALNIVGEIVKATTEKEKGVEPKLDVVD